MDSHHLLVTHAYIRSCVSSTAPHVTASPYNTLLPYQSLNSVASEDGFSPLYLRRKGSQLVSCYALFQGWLLLSQPPSCLRLFTSFYT